MTPDDIGVAGAPQRSEAPALRFVPRDPAHPDAAALLARLSAALEAVTGNSGDGSFDAADVRGAGAAFVVAYAPDGEPVACGGYRPLGGGVAEVKRLYAAQKGAGRPLLAALEAGARQAGHTRLVCETRRVNARAVAFYLRVGWRVCENYGKYAGRPEAVCFEKPLCEAQAGEAR